MRQAELNLRRHGGKRKGAGRKPKNGRAGVSHAKRPVLKARFPVHVTLRMCRTVYNLRSRRCFTALSAAFRAGTDRFGFRLIRYSVQGNHVHLIVEANDNQALSKGMQGLTIRMARALNRVMNRKGKVFADRYHAHVLKTLNEVRNAIHYLLNNHRNHIAGLPLDYKDPFVSVEPITAPQTWFLNPKSHRSRSVPTRRSAASSAAPEGAPDKRDRCRGDGESAQRARARSHPRCSSAARSRRGCSLARHARLVELPKSVTESITGLRDRARYRRRRCRRRRRRPGSDRRTTRN
jgi:putative transposase